MCDKKKEQGHEVQDEIRNVFQCPTYKKDNSMAYSLDFVIIMWKYCLFVYHKMSEDKMRK